ncbi:HAD family hydrolase [Corynebacterium uterequi]|uniref:HAD family hydrolase n=1 Tax=Corynebacterium uterequi TaxID=1072256 RepID=UPI0006414443|nr:HAD family hydrolase [Corynebacterium uterequi]
MPPRLVAVDMDGTLLDGEGKIPAEFWPLLERAAQQSVTIAPASGRQLATLQAMFDDRPAGSRAVSSFIAENGTAVSHNGKIISTTPMPDESAHRVIDVAAGLECWLVVCRPEAAYVLYIEDDYIREQVQTYHRSMRVVEDLHSVVNGEVIKLAFITPHVSEDYLAPVLRETVPECSVAVSGKHWVDVMSADANKGVALLSLAQTLGVAAEDTIAFGDYLNDMELLRAAGVAYAMANAHPEIKAIADVIAPSNVEHGVITELNALLG